MAQEPITQAEYDRERAILDNMGAPPAAYEELDARPIMPDPYEELANIEENRNRRLEGDGLAELDAAEAEADDERTLLPPVVDRSADVKAIYDDTLAALTEEGTGPKTAEAIAYIVATLHVADLPTTMGQFRQVLDQLQAVFGSGKAGGMLGKLLGGRR